jgi:rubrerythrin
MSIPPKRLSQEWWATVTHELQAHVREEERFIEGYRELVDVIGDQGMRRLVQLIIEDEERHHELMRRIAREARGDGRDESASAAPRFSPEDANRLLELTERFLDAEREDRRRLRALADTLHPLEHDSLWPLMLELMEIDTRKHVRILEYLRARMRAAQR